MQNVKGSNMNEGIIEIEQLIEELRRQKNWIKYALHFIPDDQYELISMGRKFINED